MKPNSLSYIVSNKVFNSGIISFSIEIDELKGSKDHFSLGLIEDIFE